MDKNRLGKRIVAAALSAGLVGCGGGGGGGGNGEIDDGQDGTSAPVTLEYFQSGKGLEAIAPSAPNQKEVVDPNAAAPGEEALFGALAMPGGSWQSKAGVVAPYPERIVYPREDGTLWQVTAESDLFPPTPQQLSSEDQADPLCYAMPGADYSSFDNSRYVYGVGSGSGSNASCDGSLTWKVVQMGEGSTEAPGDFPGWPLAPILNTGDGSLDGFLVADGGVPGRTGSGDLLETGPDGGNSETITSYSNFAHFLGVLPSGVMLVNIDGELHKYDPTTDVLKSLGHTFAQGSYDIPQPADWAHDGSELFWVNAEGDTLYRTDIAKSQVLKLDENSNPSDTGGDPGIFSLGETRGAWSFVRDPDGTLGGGDEEHVVRGFDLDATGPGGVTVLHELGFDLGSSLGGAGAGGGRVFYTYSNFATGQLTAFAQPLDGASREEFPQDQWVGSAPDRDQPGVAQPPRREHLFLVTGLDPTTISPEMGDHLLKEVAAADPAGSQIDLGILSKDLNTFSAGRGGHGPARLGHGTSPDGSGSVDTDVLFFERGEPGSLQRVTDTDNYSEIGVPGS